MPPLPQGAAPAPLSDRASDAWALGMLAFEVLTGRPLLGAEEWADEDVVAALLG